MGQEWKICIVGHLQTPWVNKARQGQDPCIIILRKAKPSSVYQTYFSVSSLPQCWSQAVVCVSTPRMYPQSRYFLVHFKVNRCDVSLEGHMFTRKKKKCLKCFFTAFTMFLFFIFYLSRTDFLTSLQYKYFSCHFILALIIYIKQWTRVDI